MKNKEYKDEPRLKVSRQLDREVKKVGEDAFSTLLDEIEKELWKATVKK